MDTATHQSVREETYVYSLTFFQEESVCVKGIATLSDGVDILLGQTE